MHVQRVLMYNLVYNIYIYIMYHVYVSRIYNIYVCLNNVIQFNIIIKNSTQPEANRVHSSSTM
jgi:hypothetical protein